MRAESVHEIGDQERWERINLTYRIERLLVLQSSPSGTSHVALLAAVSF